ncbi:DUF6518 family protein [Jatrophihabitans sp. YIM 134969]
MTSVLQRPEPTDLFAPGRPRPVLFVALVAGAALGVVDLLLQVALPYPWANLANSSAVWALAAFAYGAWVGVTGVRAAVGGAVLLVTAVVTYYLAAVPILGDEVATVWAPASLAWAAFGVLAGVLFGFAGTGARRPDWRRPVAAAVAGAVCFAEFAVLLVHADAGTPDDASDLVWTAVITAALGLGTLVAAARTVPAIGRALLLSVPIAALGFAGFVAGGFTGGLGG